MVLTVLCDVCRRRIRDGHRPNPDEGHIYSINFDGPATHPDFARFPIDACSIACITTALNRHSRVDEIKKAVKMPINTPGGGDP